jgi:hypothetical protein
VADDLVGNTETIPLIADATTSTVAPPLPDYSSNSIVDSGDYVMWRKTSGKSGLALYSGADGNGDGTINQYDYAVWRAHFGETLSPPGAGSGLSGATSSEVAVALVHESTGTEDLDRLAIDQPSQTVVSRGTSVEGLGLKQPKNRSYAFASASLPFTRVRSAVRRPLSSVRTIAASRHDDGLVAWLALQPSTQRQLEDSASAKTGESKDTDDASDAQMDCLEEVFAQLASV